MKKTKKILFLILSLIVMLNLLTSCREYSKSTDPNEYLRFSLLEDDTYEVIGFSSDTVKNLVIPATYNDKKVTSIGEYAFKMQRGLWGGKINLPIESVVIEEGITTIKDEAFFDCGSKKYELPDSIVDIGNEVFKGDEEIEINIPKNLKQAGDYAFFNAVFENDELYLDDIVLGEYCFSSSNIKTVTLSSYYTEISSGCFSGCERLESVILPNTITTIGINAFSGCTYLKTFDLPDSLATIGQYAFSKCSSLTEITIKENVQSIEDYAFQESGLQEVNFLAHGIIVGRASFGNCEDLNDINLNNCRIGNDMGLAFQYSPSKNITVDEESIYEIFHEALVYKRKPSEEKYRIIFGQDNFAFFDECMVIDRYAFYGRTFDELNLPKGVVVNQDAFRNAKINKLNIAIENVNNIFEYASIKEASISSSKISRQAFNHVDDLETLYILDGCEEIVNEAFVCLFSLKTVYLPKTLKKVEMGAFIQCHEIKDIYYDLEEGDPISLYAGNFITYISNVLTKDDRIKATINEELKIHVNKNIYENCLEKWKAMPNNEKYIYHDILTNHIVIDD